MTSPNGRVEETVFSMGIRMLWETKEDGLVRRHIHHCHVITRPTHTTMETEKTEQTISNYDNTGVGSV